MKCLGSYIHFFTKYTKWFFLFIYFIILLSNELWLTRLTSGCVGVLAATVHEPGAPEQHGPADSEWLVIYQPLQHRPCTKQRDGTLALRTAQLHLWCPLSIPCHPFQHRLSRPTQLRCVLPAVKHRQVGHLDGKRTSPPHPDRSSSDPRSFFSLPSLYITHLMREKLSLLS